MQKTYSLREKNWDIFDRWILWVLCSPVRMFWPISLDVHKYWNTSWWILCSPVRISARRATATITSRLPLTVMVGSFHQRYLFFFRSDLCAFIWMYFFYWTPTSSTFIDGVIQISYLMWINTKRGFLALNLTSIWSWLRYSISKTYLLLFIVHCIYCTLHTAMHSPLCVIKLN